MNLDITEEEREFLERVCTRAKIFTNMKIHGISRWNFENDSDKLDALILKLRMQNSNLINDISKETP